MFYKVFGVAYFRLKIFFISLPTDGSLSSRPNQPLCKVLEEESVELEARRKGLEETQEVGRQELDAGREELKLAAEGLEREKEGIRAARKVVVLG